MLCITMYPVLPDYQRMDVFRTAVRQRYGFILHDIENIEKQYGCVGHCCPAGFGDNRWMFDGILIERFFDGGGQAATVVNQLVIT